MVKGVRRQDSEQAGCPGISSCIRLILHPVPKLEEVAVLGEEFVNQLVGYPHIHMPGPQERNALSASHLGCHRKDVIRLINCS